MSNEAIVDLKRCVKTYRDLDDEIRELNKQVYSKREDRKIVELEMSTLVKLPQFEGIDKLKIDDDGSTIKIGRPGTYNKPWSLSKNELETLVTTYFQKTGSPSADGCIQFITEERRKSLIGKEVDVSRVIPKE